MPPSQKDLFQAGLRIAGIVFLYFSVPHVCGELLSLPGIARELGALGSLWLILRCAWEVLVPLWLVTGAGLLADALFEP
jgi:hypothetical protein